ncbi:MAG: methyltransferase domain-containing protein [Nitrospinae bacterium]|nr:methyltransferase domain-containing protein [Nitrospinota bacterium]
MAVTGTEFHRYLDWKERLDRRSLSAPVQQAFVQAVIALGCQRLRVLDCGTGTGAMIRRLIEWELAGQLDIMGLDVDATLLSAARDRFTRWARERGYTLHARRETAGAMQVFTILTDHTEATVRLYHHDLYTIQAFEAGLPIHAAFDVVTALSLADLLEEERGLHALLHPIRPLGLLYLLLNYDHETIFEPTLDRSWEAVIIQAYHHAIERGSPGRCRPGASYIGRRLFHVLQRYRCEVVAYGASDWVSYPRSGGYPEHDAQFLQQILAWVYAAAQACETLDAARVERWYRHRLQQLEQGELVYICRQNDILCRRLA